MNKIEKEGFKNKAKEDVKRFLNSVNGKKYSVKMLKKYELREEKQEVQKYCRSMSMWCFLELSINYLLFVVTYWY